MTHRRREELQPRIPAAIPPPLARAVADIKEEATEPAAIPAPVKPAAVRTAGAATTVSTISAITV